MARGDPSPEDVALALSGHTSVRIPALPGRRNDLEAGVLVPLRWGDELECVVTLRAPRLAQHGGEVSFPGGKPEPDDADLCATALREAREELDVQGAEVLGRLSSVPVYTSEFRIDPWVARIDPGPLRPHAGEVARALVLSLSGVLSSELIEAIPFERANGEVVLSPIFRPGGELMFGATAHCFLELLQVLAPLYDAPVPPLVPGDLTWPMVRDGTAR